MNGSAALEQLFDAHGADLYAYLARRGGPDDAEDALSEVFLTAWRRRDTMPADRQEARLWLFGVAANIVRNQHRAVRRRQALVRRLAGDRTWLRYDAADSGADALRDAIDALPSELAELVRLRHWEGFTLTEVAAIMAIPAPTARTRYRAARRRLRGHLESTIGDGLDQDRHPLSPGPPRPTSPACAPGVC